MYLYEYIINYYINGKYILEHSLWSKVSKQTEYLVSYLEPLHKSGEKVCN